MLRFIFGLPLLPLIFASSLVHEKLQNKIISKEFDAINILLQDSVSVLQDFEPETWFLVLGFNDDHDDYDSETVCEFSHGEFAFKSLKQICVFMAENFKNINTPVRSKTPLSVALLRNNKFALKRLLKRADLDVNLAFKADWTPLVLAIKLSQPENVQTLIQNGADVNVISDGLSALHHACELDFGPRRDQIIRTLLLNDARISLDGPEYQFSHLPNASEKVVKLMLESARLNQSMNRRNFVIIILLIFYALYAKNRSLA